MLFLHFKNDRQTICGYLDMSMLEKILKYEGTCYFKKKKKNRLMVLFPIDKFRLTNENLDLRKFVYSAVSLTTALQDFKDF